ncbi:MAG: hypothetical protein LC798_21510 [Chloroflexi bacterium]|nr:hypothetical protein [Chloroflexota bacterium]
MRVTWRQSDGKVQFFTSTGGITWTQLGIDRTIAIASIFSGTSILELGSQLAGTSNPLSGNLYRAQVRNGIDGTVVADYDPSLAVAPYATFTDSTGKVWTFNRSATGRKLAVVGRSMFLFGTDDYMTTPDHPDLDLGAGESMTAVAVARVYHQGLDYRLFSKYQGSGGWTSFISSVSTAAFYTTDGTDSANAQVARGALGFMRPYAGRIDRATSLQRAYADGVGGSEVSTAAVDNCSNALALRVGMDPAGTFPLDGEFVAGAIVKRALSDADVVALGAELAA